MNDSGSFSYRKHSVSYKIGKYLGNWGIRVHIKIDDNEPTTFRGTIPVRLPDIKKMVHYLLFEKPKTEIKGDQNERTQS